MAESTNETVTGGQAENTEQVETVTMTKAELDQLLQQTGDKRVAQALRTQEKKQKEADKLRSMTDEQRHEYELNERERAIEAKERELALAEMKTTASKILLEKGLDISLVGLVVNEDGEVTNDNIKTLEKAFKASVKSEVEKRIGSKTPPKVQEPDTITKEQFAKMSLMQKQELFNNNREIYNSLVGVK